MPRIVRLSTVIRPGQQFRRFAIVIAPKVVVGASHPMLGGFVVFGEPKLRRALRIGERWPTEKIVLRSTSSRMDGRGITAEHPLVIEDGGRRHDASTVTLKTDDRRESMSSRRFTRPKYSPKL